MCYAVGCANEVIGVQSRVMSAIHVLQLGRRAAGRHLVAVTGALISGVGLPAGLAWADEPPTDSPTPAGEVAGLIPASPSAPSGSEAPPEIGALEIVLLSLVNGARSNASVAPLQWDGVMAGVARQHARDMMTRGTVSHNGSDGSTPQQRLRRAGVDFRFGSENIWTYWGKVPDEGPRTMHAAMMAEPFRPGLWNHIGNILYGGYRRIGIGIVAAPSGVQYLSEKFAD